MFKINWQYIEVTIHVLIWSMYFFLMEVGLGSFWDPFEKYHIRTLVFMLPIVFYLNTFFFIPRYLRKRKWFTYVAMCLTTLVIVEMARSSVAAYINEDSFITHFSLKPFHSRALISNTILGFILSTGYKFTKDWIINLTIIDRLKSENLSRELSFLKAQVDPHFLFNTLNSLYALALQENSDKTADGIIKLSTLMRYNLHDSQAPKISILKEIGYIEKYISLQRLRASEKNKITFELQKETHELEIAPMLLIPFVENAFKYSLNPIEIAFIEVSIIIIGNDLTLKVCNSIATNSIGEKSGIGLKNVKNRLELLYPDSHSLLANKIKNEFQAELRINLSK